MVMFYYASNEQKPIGKGSRGKPQNADEMAPGAVHATAIGTLPAHAKAKEISRKVSKDYL